MTHSDSTTSRPAEQQPGSGYPDRQAALRAVHSVLRRETQARQLRQVRRARGEEPAEKGLAGIVTIVVLALCFGLGPTAMHVFQRMDEREPMPPGTDTTPVPTLTGPPLLSASPEAPPAALRDVEPVSVVGPTWQDGEKTYTMAFRGVPFAFRVGAQWGCMGGEWEDGEGTSVAGDAWRCIDEQTGPGRPQVDVLVRRCDGGCDRRERSRLDTDWLDRPVRYQRRDATTRYAEAMVDGRYTLVVSHFFAERPGGAPTWQVAVAAESRPADRAMLQKIVNDIRTQSG